LIRGGVPVARVFGENLSGALLDEAAANKPRRALAAIPAPLAGRLHKKCALGAAGI